MPGFFFRHLMLSCLNRSCLEYIYHDVLEKENTLVMPFTPQTYHFQYCYLMLEGGKKYQIKGCAGQGGFAQVFKAHVDSYPDEVVALKVVAYAFSVFSCPFL